ncbi:MAG TPA: hypothetical protein VN922_18520 [Bacteroidia bacterium]|nr:hypothetical protein [Bacteroidia bacterium]
MKNIVLIVFAICSITLHAQSKQDSVVYGVMSVGVIGTENDLTKVGSSIFFSDGHEHTQLSKDFKYIPEVLNYLSHMGWRVVTNTSIYQPNNNTDGFIWMTYTLEKVIKK